MIKLLWAATLAVILLCVAQEVSAKPVAEPGCYPVWAAIADQLAEHGASTKPPQDWRAQMIADKPFVDMLVEWTGYENRTVRAELHYLALAVTYHGVTYDRLQLERYLAHLLLDGLSAEYMAGTFDAPTALRLLDHLYCEGEPV